MLLVACSASDAGDKIAANPVRRVLVIYSDERLLPANVIADEAIRATFAAESSNPIEFHSDSWTFLDFPARRSNSESGIFCGINIGNVRPTW